VETLDGDVLAWLYVLDGYEGGLPSAVSIADRDAAEKAGRRRTTCTTYAPDRAGSPTARCQLWSVCDHYRRSTIRTLPPRPQPKL
jgi:hypothetical protein